MIPRLGVHCSASSGINWQARARASSFPAGTAKAFFHLFGDTSSTGHPRTAVTPSMIPYPRPNLKALALPIWGELDTFSKKTCATDPSCARSNSTTSVRLEISRFEPLPFLKVRVGMLIIAIIRVVAVSKNARAPSKPGSTPQINIMDKDLAEVGCGTRPKVAQLSAPALEEYDAIARSLAVLSRVLGRE